MLTVKGNYLLKLIFGDADVAIDTQNIKEFTIVQDIKKLVPEFRIRLIDAQGVLTHIVPFGRSMAKVTVQLGESYDSTVYNNFNFLVYRRLPEGMFGPGAIYDIRGFLDVKKLFAPSVSRGFSGTVASTIAALATEMGIMKTDISASLGAPKNLIQANWTNAEFIDFLEKELEGSDGEGGYNIFTIQRETEPILICKSIKELIKGPIRYKFIVNDVAVDDFYPILDYSLEENYMLYGAFGARAQQYEYFDFNTGQQVTKSVSLDGFTSLADYHLVDGNDSTDSDSIQSLGRSSDFSTDFTGKIKNLFYSRILNLTKMWAMTWGLPNICPGDVVRVLFAQGQAGGNLQSYQFSGDWLVERVIHTMTSTHKTRLLLTRNGLDSDQESTLVKAVTKRM